jgi:hypothetical protein
MKKSCVTILIALVCMSFSAFSSDDGYLYYKDRNTMMRTAFSEKINYQVLIPAGQNLMNIGSARLYVGYIDFILIDTNLKRDTKFAPQGKRVAWACNQDGQSRTLPSDFDWDKGWGVYDCTIPYGGTYQFLMKANGDIELWGYDSKSYIAIFRPMKN